MDKLKGAAKDFAKVKNVAFIFIKPQAVTAKVVAFVKEALKK